jgi:hypothetical protein
VAVLAAALGCSGGGAEAPPDPAAAVASSLQGEWNGPCPSSGTRPWRRNQYTFSGSDLRFSVWGFDSPLCDGSGLLLDRGFGTFAIRSSLTAAVEGAGFDVTAWQLDVTWTTSAVSRTAVALTDPRDPEPFVMFAAWDASSPTTWARTSPRSPARAGRG